MSYNLHTLKTLVENLNKAPLDVLDGKKIESLAKTIEKVLHFIEGNRAELEIQRLLASIDSQHRPLFDHIVKQSGWTREKISSGKENYVRDLHRLKADFEKELSKYRNTKKKIILSDTPGALKALAALTEEERKRLTLFTNLTKPTANGKSSLYGVPAKSPAMATWIKALKDAHSRNIITLED